MYNNANLIAILAASFGSLILGWLWYSPRVFGNIYKSLQTHQGREMTKSHMIRGFIVMFLSGMLQASVLYFLILITQAGTLAHFMTIVFLTWAGFSLSGIATDATWKGLSPRLIVIDSLFGLFSSVLMVFIFILIL